MAKTFRRGPKVTVWDIVEVDVLKFVQNALWIVRSRGHTRIRKITITVETEQETKEWEVPCDG